MIESQARLPLGHRACSGMNAIRITLNFYEENKGLRISRVKGSRIGPVVVSGGR